MSINFVPSYMNPDMTYRTSERTTFMKAPSSSFNFVPRYLDPRTMLPGITSCESIPSDLCSVRTGELRQYRIIRTYSTLPSESANPGASPDEIEINPELAEINQQTPERPPGKLFPDKISDVASRELFSPPFQSILEERDRKDLKDDRDSGYRGTSSMARYIGSLGVNEALEVLPFQGLEEEAFLPSETESEVSLTSSQQLFLSQFTAVLTEPEKQADGQVLKVLLAYEQFREDFETNCPVILPKMDLVVGEFSARPEHRRGLTPFERPRVVGFLSRFVEYPPE